MANRPRVTPLNHEILYAQSDASGNATPLTYNTVSGGLDVNIVGGSSAGTQYQEGVTTSPATGTLAEGRYQTTPPTLTNGQIYGLQLDASGNLKTTGGAAANGIISSANSTTSTLTSGSVFTGTSEDVSGYASITVSVISNVASATDGLMMQQSSDASNWDFLDVYTIPAATGKSFGVQINARYFRVVYTNGGTNQTSFRLQTTYHVVMPNASSVRPQDVRGNDNDMQEVLGYVSLYDSGTNAWNRASGGIGTVGLGTQRVIEANTATATLSNVASSATSVTLLASNTARRQATFYNDSTAILFLKFGTTASSSSYTVQLIAGAYYELPQPMYTGRIDGIWAAANGNVRITELS